MAKPDTTKWPWNNRPSNRHRFKVVFQNGNEFGEKCQRCGCHYNTRSGGTADVYCYMPIRLTPTPTHASVLSLTGDPAL